MDEISSSEFRRRYASIDKPVVVTAGGRPIGQWIPVGYSLTVTAEPDGTMTIDPPPMKGQTVAAKYPYVPRSLKLNGTDFRPAPKPSRKGK